MGQRDGYLLLPFTFPSPLPPHTKEIEQMISSNTTRGSSHRGIAARTMLIAVLVAFSLLLSVSTLASAQKPRIAVIEFDADAASNWHSWWRNQGAGAVQEVLVTELVKSGKFRVIEREKLDALLREKNLSLSGSVSAATAVEAGRLLGVEYMVTGAITEYGNSDASARTPGIRGLPRVSVKRRKFAAAINARLVNTTTGEIVWADDVREETKSAKVHVGGFGGGVEDNAMFDRVVKPACQKLVASLAAATL